MSEFKGTPGPWPGRDVHICHQDSAGLRICFLTTSSDSRLREGEANAHLIAAAPELLEALQEMVAIVKKHTYPQPDKPLSTWGRMEAAEAAIAKALGQ
ncbi:MAG: hypothetical protein E6X23_20555 [Mixta calida]|uniref:hypothetical protein n=1 Tax=Mixta calida TaxID=665913 RepID=UPI0029138211|nr:hypothetical protein [Mixta calida]MDU4943895.1 hypothetical protein [Mixta calida]